MGTIAKTVLFATIITMCVFNGNAQSSIRIQFAKGKGSASVQGSTGRYGVAYVIRVKSGQKLTLDISPVRKVGIKVETTGRYGEMVLLEEQRGGRFEVGLEEAGDYTIFIGSTTGRSEKFDLKVAVARLADI